MTYETIEVTRLTPHIGGEVSGIDLTKPLSNRQVHDINEALLEHCVLFFRDQPIDVPTLKDLGQLFGKLHISSGRKGMEEHPEVRPIHADANSSDVSGDVWHTDLSCDKIPPMGSILHIHTLPPIGGDTIWSSTYAAYDALTQPMKDFLEGLTATHDGGLIYRRYDPNGTYPVNTHPVIARHPVTKRKLIYVNRSYTSHINELNAAESAAILGYLFNLCEHQLWSVRFKWRKDSIAFWDNRCTQHYAVWDYFPQTRSGKRVQIQGANPPWA